MSFIYQHQMKLQYSMSLCELYLSAPNEFSKSLIAIRWFASVLPSNIVMCFYSYINWQSWALNTFLYLNTKYMLKMYLNTKYFLNTFVNTFLYYFQNIVLIHSIHYKFENERNIRHKISSIIQYVNNITDMHVIYYITCW